ncbi:hypothetical protein SVI_3106 [Shewanella violacea DSS12]|uniref:Uncharacterized protein n=1 Tax=Shewanella violacea (strain JCM 10179 / CIP 106290 / LMG 19151 / DSS12) TaxID=637905 RepID=D4ZAN2_SHEVD|nr:hypothetical protein SVI_3106 [Shewanella violacea DSS12]
MTKMIRKNINQSVFSAKAANTFNLLLTVNCSLYY